MLDLDFKLYCNEAELPAVARYLSSAYMLSDHDNESARILFDQIYFCIRTSREVEPKEAAKWSDFLFNSLRDSTHEWEGKVNQWRHEEGFLVLNATEIIQSWRTALFTIFSEVGDSKRCVFRGIKSDENLDVRLKNYRSMKKLLGDND